MLGSGSKLCALLSSYIEMTIGWDLRDVVGIEQSQRYKTSYPSRKLGRRVGFREHSMACTEERMKRRGIAFFCANGAKHVPIVQRGFRQRWGRKKIRALHSALKGYHQREISFPDVSNACRLTLKTRRPGGVHSLFRTCLLSPFATRHILISQCLLLKGFRVPPIVPEQTP